MAMSIESKLESAENSLTNAREKAARFVSQPDSKEYKAACIRIKACKTRIQNLKAQLAAAEATEVAKLQELSTEATNQIQILKHAISVLKNESEQSEVYLQNFTYLSDDFHAIEQAQTKENLIAAEADAVKKVIERFKSNVKLLDPFLVHPNFYFIDATSAIKVYFGPQIESLMDEFHPAPLIEWEDGCLDYTTPLRECIYDDAICTAESMIRANKRIKQYVKWGYPSEFILKLKPMQELPKLKDYLYQLTVYRLTIEAYDALRLIYAQVIFSTPNSVFSNHYTKSVFSKH